MQSIKTPDELFKRMIVGYMITSDLLNLASYNTVTQQSKRKMDRNKCRLNKSSRILIATPLKSVNNIREITKMLSLMSFQ